MKTLKIELTLTDSQRRKFLIWLHSAETNNMTDNGCYYGMDRVETRVCEVVLTKLRRALRVNVTTPALLTSKKRKPSV